MSIYKRIKGIISELAVDPTKAIRLTPGQLQRERIHQQRATRGNVRGGSLGGRATEQYTRSRRHMTPGQRMAQDRQFARRATPNLPK